MNVGELRRAATISKDGRYRYLLERTWNPAVRPMGFVMLNPSTADAEVDDPTIRRCMSFANRDECGGIIVANLFALRATNPDRLLEVLFAEAVGPENLDHVRSLGSRCTVVVAAWGAIQRTLRPALSPTLAALASVEGAPKLQCLGRTKDGSPRHPLYVRADQRLIPWAA